MIAKSNTKRCSKTSHGGETFDAPSEWSNWFSEKEQDKRKQDEAVLMKPESDKAERIGKIRI